MDVIDTQIFNQKKIERTPYFWGMQKNLIKENVQMELITHFPADNFVSANRLDGEGKHYQFEVMNIIRNDQITDAYYRLSATWQIFINELASEQYLQALSKYVERDLFGHRVDIGLFKFKQNDWVDVHTDRNDKILTQLFYFNDNWEDSWGGCLYLLGKPSLDVFLSKVVPLVSHSAVIVRADNAWHYVSPVSVAARSARLSLQLEIMIRDS